MKSKKKKNSLFQKGNLLDEFLDIDAVKKALAQSLIEGDVDSFKDIFAAFVDATNKNEISTRTSISRNTIYRAIRKENITIDKAFEILNAAEAIKTA